MRSSLNKALFWGSALILLNGGWVTAQPILLIPQKEGAIVTTPSLPPMQEATGFWEGTPPSVIESYFPKLPVRLASPVLRALRSEIIKEKYTPLLKNPIYEKNLLSLFIETGQFEQAKDSLLERDFPNKEKIFLDLQWLEGESKKACEKISNLIRTSSTPEWKLQNIYCLYLNGENERGKIAAELLSESNPHDSFLINALFDASTPPSFEPSIAKSPFLLTVWCTIGQEIPEEALKSFAPSFLPIVARSEKMPLKTRLLAAEKAFQEGAFKGEAILPLLKDAPQEDFLAKFAHELKTPKVESLLPLFQKAGQEQKLGLIADIFKSPLSKIDPSQETLALAPYMIRGFLEAGEKDMAQKWGPFFMRESPEEAIAVLPLLHLAFPQTKWNETQLQAWQAYQTRVHPETAAQNSYLLRRILEALGEAPGPAIKGEPTPSSWRQEKTLFDEKDLALLDSAVESKRKGEVLLLTLAIIGETPFKELSVDKFTRLLGPLHKTGYSQEARSLALEFLLAKGI